LSSRASIPDPEAEASAVEFSPGEHSAVVRKEDENVVRKVKK
jgi:hypothetical protein